MGQTNEEKLANNPLVKLLIEKEVKNFTLIGGAVVDIIEDRTPKDYDFQLFTKTDLEKIEAQYLYETKTAVTYKVNTYIIQVLKTHPEDFDFVISKATCTVGYKGEVKLSIDSVSFDNKTLIPCQKSWTERKNALNSLKRIPHWKKKGYTIPDETYMSLLNVVGKSSSNHS